LLSFNDRPLRIRRRDEEAAVLQQRLLPEPGSSIGSVGVQAGVTPFARLGPMIDSVVIAQAGMTTLCA